MAEFLSPEWIAALDEAVRSAAALADAADETVVVEQRVLRGPDGAPAAEGARRDEGPGDVVAYHLVLGPGPARVHPGPAATPDLVMIATLDAARRIHAGEANAQACLADGSLRLRGNPEVLTRHAGVVGRLGAALTADAVSTAGPGAG